MWVQENELKIKGFEESPLDVEWPGHLVPLQICRFALMCYMSPYNRGIMKFWK